jgi:hypothetical protein
VSSIALMTEVYPAARATLMASNLAAHSLGRALGALITAPLFALGQASLSTPDILPSALASVAFNLLALLALYFLRGHGFQPVPEARRLMSAWENLIAPSDIIPTCRRCIPGGCTS